METKKLKVIAGLVTFSILALLVLSGPVKALIVGLVIDEPEKMKGEPLSFLAELNFEQEESKEIDYLTLSLDGPGPLNYECKFSKNATILENCEGISIEALNGDLNGYGYCSGYGYGYCDNKLSYNITLNTSEFTGGTYKVQVETVRGNETFSSEVGEIRINAILKPFESCSIRGRDGKLIAGEKEFTNNKLNFFVPNKDATKGKGHLISQLGRKRFSFKFDVLEVLENWDGKTVLLVEGEYKVDGEKTSEEAIIVLMLDKVNKKIGIIGETLSLEDMQVTFSERC